MEWACASQHNALFIKIDFEKSYDKIEWNFIFVMLQALGFGPSFIASVKMLFSNASTVITLDGN